MLIIIAEYDNYSRPLQVKIYNQNTGNIEIIPCYAPGTNLILEKIDENIENIRSYFDGAIDGTHTIVTNHFKSALQAFELHVPETEYDIYDIASRIPTQSLMQSIERIGNKVHLWQKLLANASVIYWEMERTKLLHNELVRAPIWTPDTTTGRSRCTGFNIQGLPREDTVINVIRTDQNTENDILMHFDWTAADSCVAAYMSQDQELTTSFLINDPYSHLSEVLGKSREECKRMWLVAVNAQNLNSEVFEVYRVLKLWCMEQLKKLHEDGYLRTFYNRTFRMQNDTKDEQLRVFNSVLQGGTAHLMHAALFRMYHIPNVKVIADLHDGLVLICSAAALLDVLRAAKPIMSRPLDDIDICMAFRVSICKVGEGWHHWIPIRVCRDGKKYERIES